jgi:hypothetical protein
MEAVMRSIKLAHPVKPLQVAPAVVTGILLDVKATLDQCHALFEVIEDDPDGTEKSFLMAQIGRELTRKITEHIQKQIDAPRGDE